MELRKPAPFVYSGILVMTVSFVLMCSFGLHALQISHSHAEHSHHDDAGKTGGVLFLGEYMHLNDKKLLSFVLVAGVFFGALLLDTAWSRFMTLIHTWYRILYRHMRNIQRPPQSYLVYCFSRGILHPKAY